MSKSRSAIPEATCGVWTDCFELLRLRDKLRRKVSDERAKTLTPFAIIAWIVPQALRAAPSLNATYDDDAKVIRLYGDVHLGIAANTEHGLMVPTIRNAQSRSLSEVARELHRLGISARDRSLSPSELTGSSFTITNFGALGLDDGNPVINYPEAAILGVGAIRERPAVVDGLVVARPLAKLICAFDHRVCDGSDAARFLTRLKDLIEDPMQLLVDELLVGE
jgi:pyruvate dehydrogenase E2 component (dihydrolipoamide acetyltransferase)